MASEFATITVENISRVLMQRFAAGDPGAGLTLSCHEAHMLMAYFQRTADASRGKTPAEPIAVSYTCGCVCVGDAVPKWCPEHPNHGIETPAEGDA